MGQRLLGTIGSEAMCGVGIEKGADDVLQVNCDVL